MFISNRQGFKALNVVLSRLNQDWPDRREGGEGLGCSESEFGGDTVDGDASEDGDPGGVLPCEPSEDSLTLLLVLVVGGLGPSAPSFDDAVGLEDSRRQGARSGSPRRANGGGCLKLHRNGHAPAEENGFEEATGRQESGWLYRPHAPIRDFVSISSEGGKIPAWTELSYI